MVHDTMGAHEVVGRTLGEVERLRSALALIHDWAALGGEHGEQPDARIMLQARRTLNNSDHDPSSMA